ncbi:Hypothetical protein A7982_01524 [Minicystis rosea]|nr:Hypothetical protein A7982_01524 [Minicystis rosea]
MIAADGNGLPDLATHGTKQGKPMLRRGRPSMKSRAGR